MIRPITLGSATATFAPKLAWLPTMSRVQAKAPPREPYRFARRIDIEATTMVPSTTSGMRTAAKRSSP